MSALFPITARMSTIPRNALCSEQCWHSQHVSSLRFSLFSGKMQSHKRLHYLHQIHPALTDVLYRSKCPEASRLFVIQQSVSKDSWSWSSANYIWSQCHPKSADSLAGKLLWRVHYWTFPKFLLLLKATLQPSCTQAPPLCCSWQIGVMSALFCYHCLRLLVYSRVLGVESKYKIILWLLFNS